MRHYGHACANRTRGMTNGRCPSRNIFVQQGSSLAGRTSADLFTRKDDRPRANECVFADYDRPVNWSEVPEVAALAWYWVIARQEKVVKPHHYGNAGLIWPHFDGLKWPHPRGFSG